MLERKGKRARKKHRFVVPLVYAFIGDFCMSSDRGLNLQPWCTGMTLQPTEQPSPEVTFKKTSTGEWGKMAISVFIEYQKRYLLLMPSTLSQSVN